MITMLRGNNTRHSSKVMVWVMTIACLMLWACAGQESQSKPDPATVELTEGDLQIVTLTARAAQRLDIRTVPVREGQSNTTVIPHSAVVYQTDGSSWTYTALEDLVYVRHSIDVESVEGDVAVLTDGPALGTEVVTVGAAELLGIESGVGE